MFAAAMILFVEKLFLQFVAINFHQKALADRLVENRLGLKALDRLSNAPVLPARKSPNIRRGHRSPGSTASLDALAAMSLTHSQNDSVEGSPVSNEKKSSPSDTKMRIRARRPDRQKKKRPMASVIVDQVGGAIGQVAFKNYRFNREGRVSGLSSAKKLARKLFSALNDSYPPRAHLTVEGASIVAAFESPFTTNRRLRTLFPYDC